MRRRFLREARAAATVQHPSVVEVHDVFELDDETPVMVMDLLVGETLAQRIASQGPLSIHQTASILLPVVSAVGTAHSRGVVHRDLKPENIFLAENEEGQPRSRFSTSELPSSPTSRAKRSPRASSPVPGRCSALLATLRPSSFLANGSSITAPMSGRSASSCTSACRISCRSTARTSAKS